MKHFYTFLALLLIGNFASGQTTIHCWDFNGTASGGNFNSSPINTDNRVTGDGQITHNITDVEDFGGNSGNACSGSATGAAFCPRPGAGLVNNGSNFTLEFSSVGYENIVLSFYARKTSTGFDSNQVSYSTNGGTSFTNFGTPFNPNSNVISFDFSSIPAVNNNADLQIRITLDSGSGSGGNNRYDNIKLEGTVVLTGPEDPTAFSATTISSSQIDLSYDDNTATDDVVIVFNTDNVFDTPTGTPTVANLFGDDEILFVGNGTGTFNHTALTENTQYFYRAYSYDGTDYSSGIDADATTLAFTRIQFTSAAISVNEGDGTYDLELSITGEDAINATSVDVVLTGDATDIDNYTTQTVTFPAGDATNKTVTITITDDTDNEPDEVLSFNLDNISGGNSATLGAQTTFDLTILENDLPCTLSDAGLSNIACDNNSTEGNINDDLITFELNPTGANVGTTYSLSVSSGSILPATANYGSATVFTLNSGSAGAGDVTVTITDDADGGCTIDAIVTDPGSCSSICSSIFSDDFSTDLSQWSNTGDWTINSGELKHDLSGVESESYIYSDLGTQDLTSGNYEWEFCIRNGSWDPSGGNKFAFFLLSDTTNLLTVPSGYAVGVNQSGTSDLIALYRVDNGAYTEIITSTFNWNSSDNVCMSVSRNASGDWELLYNDDGSGEISAGTTTDTDYTSGNNLGAIFDFTSSRAGLLYIDDVNLCKTNDGFNAYVYNNGWVGGHDPNGVSVSVDAIQVQSGDAIINANTTCNTMTVDPGAGLTVNTGITLTASNGLTLDSNSTSYSSLILEGTITGSVTYNRHVNTFNNTTGATTGSNDLIAAPVTNSSQTFSAFRTANTNIPSGNINDVFSYLFGPFDNDTNAYVNYTEAANDSDILTAGTGYRSASTDTSTFTFVGDVETSTVPVGIDVGTLSEWNLIGNPYPSYISMSTFLTENNAAFDTSSSGIYGYDGDATDGFIVRNLGYFILNPDEYIAPGQGFLVASTASGATVNFTPSMRSTGTSDDFIFGRQGISENAFITLEISKSNAVYTTDLFFLTENVSLGLDPGFDTSVFGNVAPDDFAIFSHLIESNEGIDMAIQSLPSSSLSSVTVPLGVNVNIGEQFTISIKESTLPDNVSVYLEDNVNNSNTLLNQSDYVFTATSDIKDTGRYFLRFSEDALSTQENDIDNLNIYTSEANKEIVITGQLQQNTSFELYDVQGRLVNSTKLDNSLTENRIDVSNVNTGIYIVKLKNNGQVKSQKLIIR